MSDRLRQSLMSSRSEIEAGLAEAGAELARVRQRAAELEELIALGTATLLAAEMISGGAKTGPEHAVPENTEAVESPTVRAAPSAPEIAPAADAEPSTPPAEPEPEPSTPPVEPEPEPSTAPVEPGLEPSTATAEPERTKSVTYEDDLRALLERAQP